MPATRLTKKAQDEFTVRWISPDLLTVDHTYQRHLEDARVERIVEDFSVHEVRPLRVVRRSATEYVVEDGQHTLAALTRLGWDKVPAFIRNGKTEVKDEAALFTAINSNQKAIRPLEMFKADVVAEKPKALDIKARVEAFDLTIAGGIKTGIAAIKALEDVYDTAGPEGLTETLTVIVACWDAESDSRFSSSMLKGMSRYLLNNQGRSRERDIEKFSRYTPTEILRVAKTNSAGVSTRSVTAAVLYELERISRAKKRTL